MKALATPPKATTSPPGGQDLRALNAAHLHGYTDAAAKQIIKRFWRKVNTTNDPEECWPWRAGRSGMGYGRFNLTADDQRLAHRVALELALGHPLEGQANDRCHVRACARPSHLYEGSQEENFADMVTAGRGGHVYRSGEDHPDAKLTWPQVRVIRESYGEGGATMTALGERYGVDWTTIREIVHERTWKEEESELLSDAA